MHLVITCDHDYDIGFSMNPFLDEVALWKIECPVTKIQETRVVIDCVPQILGTRSIGVGGFHPGINLSIECCAAGNNSWELTFGTT